MQHGRQRTREREAFGERLGLIHQNVRARVSHPPVMLLGLALAILHRTEPLCVFFRFRME